MAGIEQTRRVTAASRDTLLTILETLPDAFFLVDDADTIVYANHRAQALLDAIPAACVRTSFWRSAPHLVSATLYQAVRTTRETQEPMEVEYVSPVTRTWLHVQLAPTVGGLALHVHERREPLPRRETFLPDDHLAADVLKNLYVGVGALTPEGIVLEINEAPLADAHIRRKEVVGHPFADTSWWIFSPASQEQLRAAITCARSGETVRFETQVHPREGMNLHLEVTITPHRDVDHHIAYLVYVGTDITERKRAEGAIHELVDTLPHFVWMARPDGSVTYNNQRLIDYLAMTHEQAEGTGWLAGVHPDDRPRVWEAWQTSIQTGMPYEVEHRLRNGTSSLYRWFLVRGVPQKDAQATILHWVGTCTDIDEQKQAEERAKESEGNWQVLAETVPQLMWTTLPDGSVTYWNHRWYDYTGSSPEQSLGHEWSQFLHPDDARRTLAVWHQALETGEPYEIEYRLREGQTGASRWFLARGTPVRDEASQIVKWFGTCTDIHDKKQAEDELRVLADTIPQLVWILSPDGASVYGNQRWSDYTGMTFEQYQGDGWLQAIHPDDYQPTLMLWRQACASGNPFEIEYRVKDGQTGGYRWFLGRAMPVRDDTGQIVKWFGTCTDIEDQKRVEEALRQSQERIRALIDSNIIGITSSEGEEEVLVEANEAFLQMTGYTQEDVRSRTLNRVKITPPEQAPLFQRALQEVAERGQHTPIETELVCKDGSRLSVLVGGVAFQEHPRQIISFLLDNSARKELEQRKDAFISMASHELRNPLTALKLQTTLLHRQLAKQGIQASAPALSSMETQINKVSRLVEELLDVSKIQAGRLEYVREMVDLDALVREITDTLQQTSLSHRIVVRGTVSTSMIGDPDRLGQVFINLLSNAIKYSPDAKTVEMDLNASEEAVTIRVHDHGLGIPREQRDKIFERFYRVADPKQRAIPGLGMGLYIVAEIVKGHGGTITVDSEIGKGSTITVTLPRNRDTSQGNMLP